ncbi:insulin-induced gene 2 protein isoform X2 [Hippoglossus stenolepis]|nr:insulin-induced gene 2 protein isoform X2 [Hippoglossus stenolepis]
MSLTLTAMSDSAMTSRHQQWSGVGQTQPPPRGPYISVITNRTTNLVIRGAMLFSVGVFLALVLNLLQVQRNVTLFPPDVISSIFSSAWWVPPCCGMASAMIGLLYPCIDRHLGEPHKFKREWSSVMRCVAVFVGINHASAKVDFANNIQLSLTLAALSIGLWWTFDRSRSGFGLGISIALLATLATQLLVYNGVFQCGGELSMAVPPPSHQGKMAHTCEGERDKGRGRETGQHRGAVTVPKRGGVQDEEQRDPGALLGTVPIPVHQVHFSRFPVHSLLVTLYLLCRGDNDGEHRTAASLV